jgi:hypothetical protein
MTEQQANEDGMQLKRGQHVEHPMRPEWGIGEVLDVAENKVTVNFQHAGPKKLDLRVVALRSVWSVEPVPFKIDVARLEVLCNRFHADQEHNRRGVNDGNVAMEVLADVKRRGSPTADHRQRLLNWCYTEGNPFQSGVELAREICSVIYGRVLPDPDAATEASGGNKR